jgi:hypothetical protein
MKYPSLKNRRNGKNELVKKKNLILSPVFKLGHHDLRTTEDWEKLKKYSVETKITLSSILKP